MDLLAQEAIQKENELKFHKLKKIEAELQLLNQEKELKIQQLAR